MVVFEQVAVRYGRGPIVLRDVSFHLREGSFHFLTGPSGAVMVWFRLRRGVPDEVDQVNPSVPPPG